MLLRTLKHHAKSTLALLLLVFVLVQSAAFLHSASHGFASHKHAATACEVQTYCEELVLSTTPVIPILLFAAFLAFLPVARRHSLVKIASRSTIRSRAPPSFL